MIGHGQLKNLAKNLGIGNPVAIAWPYRLVSTKADSQVLAMILDGAITMGVALLMCGVAGIGDNNADAEVLIELGVLTVAVGAVLRSKVTRGGRLLTRNVITGVGFMWVMFILVGALVYWSTGSIASLGDSVIEATFGATTMAATLLDPREVSRSVLLWRATSSWLGGLVGITVVVVAMPGSSQAYDLLGYNLTRYGRDFIASAEMGIKRVFLIYLGLTAACVVGYLVAGLDQSEAVVLALGTVSTGGFSPQVDSMASYSASVKTVATVGMLIAGASIFVLWGMLKRRVVSLWRSQELRTYLGLLLAITFAIFLFSEAHLGDALFTSASVLSTTGYAATDWTIWPPVVTATLLVAMVVGSMLGSAGGGVWVLRVRLLFDYAKRELGRQLAPHAVMVIKRDGKLIDESVTHHMSAYHVTYIIVAGCGAVALGATGLSVSDSIWSAFSAMSTLGLTIDRSEAFAHFGDLSKVSLIVLMPLMIAGRVTLFPLLAVVDAILQSRMAVTRRMLWLRWQIVRRVPYFHR